MKLAIIDLDGVVANVDARFAEAEKAKQTFLQDKEARIEALFSGPGIDKEATNLYWRTVFNPDLVPLDTVIDGANDALLDIQVAGYKVIFLTSRPEHIRDATTRWLFEHTVFDAGDVLIMKHPSFQYVKTAVWKAGLIPSLAWVYTATDLLIVENWPDNLAEIGRYPFPTFVQPCIAKSLAEAVARLNGTWVEPDPFLPPE